MATAKQDKEFLALAIPEDLLSQAQDYISSHMNPEDVFTAEKLEDWAHAQGMIYNSED